MSGIVYPRGWRFCQQHIWQIEAGAEFEKNQELKFGFYFEDETSALNGPYRTEQEAVTARDVYCNSVF